MVSAERLRDENSEFKYSDWNYEGGCLFFDCTSKGVIKIIFWHLKSPHVQVVHFNFKLTAQQLKINTSLWHLRRQSLYGKM